MGLFAGFFFGKDKATLEAMKQDRLNRIEELKKEIAEIDALIEKSED